MFKLTIFIISGWKASIFFLIFKKLSDRITFLLLDKANEFSKITIKRVFPDLQLIKLWFVMPLADSWDHGLIEKLSLFMKNTYTWYRAGFLTECRYSKCMFISKRYKYFSLILRYTKSITIPKQSFQTYEPLQCFVAFHKMSESCSGIKIWNMN